MFGLNSIPFDIDNNDNNDSYKYNNKISQLNIKFVVYNFVW